MIKTRMCPAAITLLFAALPALCADEWIRLATPDFELYTNAGGKNGREAMRHFEQVRGFFLKASPVRPPSEFPVRVVVFKTNAQFQLYTPNPVGIAYFASSPMRDYIVMQEPSPESYPIAIHEYMHLIVRHSGLRIPLWLNEGWADVYSTLRPVPGGVAVGDLIAGRMQLLATSRLMDLETLNSIDARSPAYHESDRAGVFYAESWALTHMLFLSPEYRDHFGKFLMAIHRGKPLSEALATAFGRTEDQVFDDLRTYLQRKKIYGEIFDAAMAEKEPEPEMSALPDFDSSLMLADLLIATRRFAEAKLEYERLGKLRPDRPEVVQSLGFLAFQLHDPEGARRDFEKAFAEGASDPRMCFLLAILEKDAKQPAEKIIAPLERAVNSKPDYSDALLQLGVTETATRDFDSAIAHLMKIPAVTPGLATPLFLSLAYAYLETGDVEKARNNIRKAREWARAPLEITQAERLADLIEARAKGPFAVRPAERMQRIEGDLEAVNCAADNMSLELRANGQTVTFALPRPEAVEYQSAGDAGDRRLRCGPQSLRVTLEFVERETRPVVRRIEFEPAR